MKNEYDNYITLQDSTIVPPIIWLMIIISGYFVPHWINVFQEKIVLRLFLLGFFPLLIYVLIFPAILLLFLTVL